MTYDMTLGTPPFGVNPGFFPPVNPMLGGYNNPIMGNPMSMQGSIMPGMPSIQGGINDLGFSDGLGAPMNPMGFNSMNSYSMMSPYNPLPQAAMPGGSPYTAIREYHGLSIPGVRQYGVDSLIYDESLSNIGASTQKTQARNSADVARTRAGLQEQAMQDNLARQERFEQVQSGYQLRQSQRYKAAAVLSQAPENAVAMQAAILQRTILNNDQDNVLKEYNELANIHRKQFEKAGYSIPSEQLRAQVFASYCNTTGSNLLEDLQSHGRNPFAQGFAEFLFGWNPLVDNKSKTDNIAAITSTEVSKKDKNLRIAGQVVSVIATAALLPFIIKMGGRGLKNIGNAWLKCWSI